MKTIDQSVTLVKDILDGKRKLKGPPPKPFKWRKIYLPKHSGKILPETAIIDISYYFGFMYNDDVIFAALAEESPSQYEIDLAHQFEAVANRVQHILVPPHRRDDHEFVLIVDKDRVFERFLVLKKGSSPKKRLAAGSEIVARCTELDITMPFHYRNEDVGLARMSRCLRNSEYFDNLMCGISPANYGTFLRTDNNFNLEAFESHKTVETNMKDHKLLTARYRDSLS